MDREKTTDPDESSTRVGYDLKLSVLSTVIGSTLITAGVITHYGTSTLTSSRIFHNDGEWTCGVQGASWLRLILIHSLIVAEVLVH